MKKFYFIFAVVLFCVFPLKAAEKNTKPLSFVADDIKPVRIWANHPVPFAVPEDSGRKEILIKPNSKTRRISQISDPELYPFIVPGGTPRPAVIIAPGGGYSYVAWEPVIKVGYWLQKNGFNAFILKYRCPRRRDAALTDMARAIRLIRYRAKEFNVDPLRVGVIGFSAGGHLCASVSAFSGEPYPAMDEADKLNYRPDFAALIYPAYLVKDVKNLTLASNFKVDKTTPPTFLVQTADDPIKVENALAWHLALLRSGVSCEMHIWDKGGHGYGISKTNHPVSDWPEIALKWLRRVTGKK